MCAQDEIEKLELELKQMYYELGKTICEMSDHKVEEINRMVDKLVEAKIKMREMNGGKKNE